MHELVYFLTFRKNGIMFFLLVKEVKVFYLNDPRFCFWYRNIDVSNSYQKELFEKRNKMAKFGK